jgi:hypothetical protein
MRKRQRLGIWMIVTGLALQFSITIVAPNLAMIGAAFWLVAAAGAAIYGYDTVKNGFL